MYLYHKRRSGLLYVKHKENPTSFKKGLIPANKGKRDIFKGKTKDGLHDWVERNFGKAKDGKCKNCGSKEKLQWSNKSGEYIAIFSDWQILCTKCHQRYDYEHFGARKEFYIKEKYEKIRNFR